MSNIDRFSASKLQSAADQKKKKDNQQSGGTGRVSASRFDAGYMQRAADYQKEQERIRQSMITAAQTGTPFSPERALQMSRQGGLWTGVSNAMEKQFGAELNNPADRADAIPSKGTLLRQYDRELDTKIAAQDEQIKALQNQWAQTSTSYAGRRDGRDDDIYRAQREEAMKAQNEAKATKEYLLSRKALIGENLIVFEAAENGDLDLFEDYYKEHVTNQANRGTAVLGQNTGDSWLGSLPAEVAYAQSSVRENTAKNELKKRGYTDEQILHYINARNGEGMDELIGDVKEFTAKHPIIAEAAKVATVPVRGIAGALGMVMAPGEKHTGYSLLNEGARAINETESALISTAIEATANRIGIQGKGAKTLGKLGTLIYSAADSALESAVAMGTGGHLGEVMLGLSAATDAYNEGLDKGLPTGRAITTGVVAGVFETLFEHLSLENLRGLSVDTSNVGSFIGKKGFINFLKSAFTEGSEEFFTDIANEAYDYLINGGYSNFQRTVRDLMAEGMSEEKAKQQYAKDFGLQLAEDFAVGAMSGGMGFGSRAGVVNARVGTETSNIGRAVRQMGKDTEGGVQGVLKTLGSKETEGLTDKSGSYKVGRATLKAFDEYDKRFRQTVKTTAEQAGTENTVKQINGMLQEAGLHESEAGKVAQAYVDFMTQDKVAYSTLRTIATNDAAVEYINNQLSGDNYSAARELRNKILETASEGRINQKIKKKLEKWVHADEFKRAEAQGEVLKKSADAVQTGETAQLITESVKASTADGQVQVKGIAGIEDGKIKVTVDESGATDDLDNITFDETKDGIKGRQIYTAVADMMRGAGDYNVKMSATAANLVIALAQNTDTPVEVFLQDAYEAYKAGTVMRSRDTVEVETDYAISNKEIEAMYAAGAAEYKVQKGVTRIGTQKMTEAQTNMLQVLDRFFMAHNLSLIVVDNLWERTRLKDYRLLGENYKDEEHGTEMIVIALNAGRNKENVLDLTAYHELFHWMKKQGPDGEREAQEMIDDINEGAKAKDTDGYQEMVDELTEVGYTADEIAEEIACQYIGTLMSAESFRQQTANDADAAAVWGDSLPHLKDFYDGVRGYIKQTFGYDKRVQTALEEDVDTAAGWVARFEGTLSYVQAQGGAGNGGETKYSVAMTKEAEEKVIRDSADVIKKSLAFAESGAHEKLIDEAWTDAATLPKSTATERYRKIIDIWKKIGGNINSEFLNAWDKKVGKDRAFEIFKAQSGYKYNAELASMCKKGIALFDAIDVIVKKRVIEELGIEKLGKHEKEILYDILKNHGHEIPCAICYVEQARQREGTIIRDFVDGNKAKKKLGWNQALDKIEERMQAQGVNYEFGEIDIAGADYTPADAVMSATEQNAFYNAVYELVNEEIENANKTAKKKRTAAKAATPQAINAALKGSITLNMRVYKSLVNELQSRYRLPANALYSSVATQNIAKGNHELYKTFNMQGGVSGYKTKQTPIVYWGDILKMTDKPAAVRKAGGIRWQSNSDFQMYTFLDRVQYFLDMTAKGYYHQEYTKVPAALKLFGLMRGKQNASLIPAVHIFRNADGSINEELTRENAGLDENGEPIYDKVEGIDPDEAFMIAMDREYSKSVGTICVAYSDNHIWKLLDDERVSMIIGFHDKTDNPEKRYRGARYAHNYNGENEAKNAKGETVHVDFSSYIIKAENKFKKTGEAFTGTTTFNGKTYTADDIPKLAADIYLSELKAKGWTPAYEKFAGHKNYYKLLADFRLVDAEGHYAPHRPVQFFIPETVPVRTVDGNGNVRVEQMDTAEYIQTELEKEMRERDAIARDLADTSEDGIIPQFKRAIREENKSLSRALDDEYMAAVEAGDEETQARLVKQAAKAAGYNYKGFHGTAAKFTWFDKSRSGENWEGDARLGPGFYFAYDKDTALKWTEGTRVIDAYLSMRKPLDVRKKAPEDIAQAIRNRTNEKLNLYDESYPITKEQYKSNLRSVEEIMLDDPAIFLNDLKYDENGKMTDGIERFLKSLGYDGIISEDEMVVFDPEQIKSADPVVYDNDGNVIPLSERFNQKNTDIRYSRAGIGSRTADNSLLAQAQQMRKDGEDSETIRKTTGWYRSYDGKWSYEIDDSEMEIITTKYFADSISLEELINHEKLFAAYPELRTVRVKYDLMKYTPGTSGATTQKNEILLNDKLRHDKQQLKKVLIHEIQHVIQSIENFSRGASPSEYRYALRAPYEIDERAKKANATLDTLRYGLLGKNADKLISELRILLYKLFDDSITLSESNRLNDIENQIKNTYGEGWKTRLFDAIIESNAANDAYDKWMSNASVDRYLRTAGEIEARDAENRLDYTEQERIDKRPDIDQKDVYFAERDTLRHSRVLNQNAMDYVQRLKSGSRQLWEMIDILEDRAETVAALREYLGAAPLDMAALRRIAKKYNHSFDHSKAYVESLAMRLAKAQEMLATGANVDTVLYGLYKIAEKEWQDTGHWEVVNEDAQEFIDYLRPDGKMPVIYMDESTYSSVAAGLGGRKAFRDRIAGKFRVTTDERLGGTALDDFYSAARDQNKFPLPETMEPSEQMRNMIELYESGRETQLVDTAEDRNLVGETLAERATDDAFNMLREMLFPKEMVDKARKQLENSRPMTQDQWDLINMTDRLDKLQEYVQTERRRGIQSTITKADEELQKRLEALSKSGKTTVEIEIERDRLKQEYRMEALRRAYAQRVESVREYYKEQAQKEGMRRDIKRNLTALMNLFNKESDSQHVPEVLKKTVLGFLAMFDKDRSLITAVNMHRIAEFADEIRDVGEDEIPQEYAQLFGRFDEDIRKDIDELIKKIEKIETDQGMRVHSSMLSLDDMRVLNNTAEHIRFLVESANEAFVDGKRKKISAIAERIIARAKTVTRNKLVRTLENNKIGKKVIKAETDFMTKMWTPIYLFDEKIGGAMADVYEGFRNGQDEWYRRSKEGKKVLHDAEKKYEYDKWKDEKIHFSFPATLDRSAWEVDMPIEAVLQIYATLERERRSGNDTAHLLEGGVVLSDDLTEANGLLESLKDTTGKKMQARIEAAAKKATEQVKANKHTLSWEELLQITQHPKFTKQMKDYADEIVKYMSTDVSRYGNDATMALSGIRKFNEEYYFPFQSAKDYLYTRLGVSDDTRLKNAGFTKRVKHGANTPLILSGFTSVAANHIQQMALFSTMTVPIDTLQRVINYQQVSLDEKGKTIPGEDNVKTALKNAYGEAVMSYINTFVTQVNGGIRTDPLDSLWNKGTSMFKRAAVMGNLSVVVQQPSAMMRATAIINPKYFFGKASVADYREMMEHAPIAGIKEMGGFDTGTGRGAVAWMLDEATPGQRITELWGKPAEIADAVAWTNLWNACKRETRDKHPELEYGSDAFYDTTYKRFRDIVDYTQVYDSTLSKNELMRGAGGLTKMVTAFMAEPSLSLNMLMMSGKGRKINKGRALAAFAANIIVNSMFKAIVAGWRDKDEDESYSEKWLEHFVSDLVGDKNVLFLDGAWSPVGMVPWVKDILSLWQGYNVDRSDISAISDLIESAKGVGTAFDKFDGTWQSIDLEAIADFAGSISAITPMPMGKAIQDVMGITRVIFNKVVKPFEISWETARQTALEGMGFTTANAEKAYDAAMRNNTEYIRRQLEPDAEKIKQYIATGNTPSEARANAMVDAQQKWENAVRDGILAKDERAVQAAEARYNGDTNRYELLVDEMVADGLPRNSVIGAIKSLYDALKPEEAENKTLKDKSLYTTEDLDRAVRNNDLAAWKHISEELMIDGKSEDSISNVAKTYAKELAEDGDGKSARQVLTTFAGMGDNAAAAKVRSWQHPDGLSADKWVTYYDKVADTGISADVYEDYATKAAACKGTDNNGDGKTDSGSKKEQVMEVIDSLPITSEQKDVLYRLHSSWAESKLSEAPWH